MAPEPGGVTRRGLLVGGFCALCAGVAGYEVGRVEKDLNPVGPGVITNSNWQRRRFQPDAVFGVPTSEKVVALTFDDGPDERYTTSVLDQLASHNAHATFFQIGVNALAYPALSTAVHDAGHTIGNHTFDHADLERLRPSHVEDEIDRGEAALVKVGLPRPTLFRPPKGFTDEVVDVVADGERYRTVFWGLCVERFVDHTDVRDGVIQLLGHVRPGDIILAHDGGKVVGVPGRPVLSRERTMEALPLLLAGLTRLGFKVVDIPTLLRARP